MALQMIIIDDLGTGLESIPDALELLTEQLFQICLNNTYLFCTN